MNGDFVVHHIARLGSAVPMDQGLEKAYNKPAKDNSGIIVFSRRKEAVAKWNIIKHEKVKYKYSHHHEFSEAAIKYDDECVQQVVTFIQERFNHFEVGEAAAISNIVTNSQIDQETALFLLHSVENGESSREKAD